MSSPVHIASSKIEPHLIARRPAHFSVTMSYSEIVTHNYFSDSVQRKGKSLNMHRTSQTCSVPLVNDRGSHAVPCCQVSVDELAASQILHPSGDIQAHIQENSFVKTLRGVHANNGACVISNGSGPECAARKLTTH